MPLYNWPFANEEAFTFTKQERGYVLKNAVFHHHPKPSLQQWCELYLNSQGRCLALSEWDSGIRISWLAPCNRQLEKLAGDSLYVLHSIAVTLAWGDWLRWNKFPLHMKRKGVKWLQIWSKKQRRSKEGRAMSSNWEIQLKSTFWSTAWLVRSAFLFRRVWILNFRSDQGFQRKISSRIEAAKHIMKCLTH